MPEPEEKEEEKKEKKKLALPKGPIIIILSIIIGIILVFTIAIVVANKVARRDKPPPTPIDLGEEKEGHLPDAPLHNFEVGEFLAKIINPEEHMYVKIEKLNFGYNKEEYGFLSLELEKRKPQIRDIVNTILISSTKEIETAEGKGAFKKRVIDEVNKVLRDGQVKDVYCELIVQ